VLQKPLSGIYKALELVHLYTCYSGFWRMCVLDPEGKEWVVKFMLSAPKWPTWSTYCFPDLVVGKTSVRHYCCRSTEPYHWILGIHSEIADATKTCMSLLNFYCMNYNPSSWHQFSFCVTANYAVSNNILVRCACPLKLESNSHINKPGMHFRTIFTQKLMFRANKCLNNSLKVLQFLELIKHCTVNCDIQLQEYYSSQPTPRHNTVLNHCWMSLIWLLMLWCVCS